MIFRIPAETEMSPRVLAKYIGKHKAEVARRLRPLQDAYRSDYAIYRAEGKPAYKPDNRVGVNFAKYIVDTMNGFFMGIPVKVSSDSDTVNDFLQELNQYNDQDDGNSELSKMCDIYGSGHEMYYIDEDGEECVTAISPMESFFLVDDSILARPLFFIHYYVDSDNVERGSWSDGSVVQHFYRKGAYRWEGEPKPHGFAGVPAVEFVENAERMGIFESVLPMINAYNKALSEKANDVDYFSDAYMKVKGRKLEDNDILHIRDDRVINLWSDDPKGASALDADFMQRPSGDTTQEHLIDRLERLIFKISMVSDISDENFGTSSGIALRYKLQAMENLAKTKERKFASGMNQRYKLLFSNPVRAAGVKPEDWIGVHMKFTLNYPANYADEAQTAAQLEGIVSKETQLKGLSIVDDPKAEMDRMREEDLDGQSEVLDRKILGVNDGQ